ncbi:MAG TPA: hypothetical protein VJG31_04170 [Candidatus Nanoarchaeia archaeon]|nr:hypothetical protein [Candidatus Nanoarchaeia archaeon]
MADKKLSWCFKLKDGLSFVEPNSRLAKSYLTEAKSSLARAEKNFADKDLLWTTVVIYYAEYYALYSFLQKIGIKCENHFCSILAVTLLLGEEKTVRINEHKDRRIDAQYYMRVGQEVQIRQMLQEAKLFVSFFEETTLNLTPEEIENFRKIIKRLIS